MASILFPSCSYAGFWSRRLCLAHPSLWSCPKASQQLSEAFALSLVCSRALHTLNSIKSLLQCGVFLDSDVGYNHYTVVTVQLYKEVTVLPVLGEKLYFYSP